MEQIEDQIVKFQQGFPFLALEKAAAIGDGLHRLDGDKVQDLVRFYDKNSDARKVYKFVPASGAASRMFKNLMTFLNSYDRQNPDIGSDPVIGQFFKGLGDFAFFEELNNVLSGEGGVDQLIHQTRYDKIVLGLLEQMNYSNLPKGLLTFHKYPDHNRTALEEHLVEGAAYCKGVDGQVYLHFTVSPEHQSGFESLLGEVLERYQASFDVQFDISFSEQKSSTNTIAVDLNNQPFRLENEEILFRPGGHGALLANLNDIEADLVFIKNVDNVVPDDLKGE